MWGDECWSHLQHGRQPEGHDLRHPQLQAPVEDDVVVNVHHLAAARVQQDVVQVPVPKAQQVPQLQTAPPGQPPQLGTCTLQLTSGRASPRFLGTAHVAQLACTCFLCQQEWKRGQA